MSRPVDPDLDDNPRIPAEWSREEIARELRAERRRKAEEKTANRRLRAAVKPLVAACYSLTDTDDWRGVAKIMVACHNLMDTHPELFPENCRIT